MTRNKEKGWRGMQVSNTLDFRGSQDIIYCNFSEKGID